MSKERNYDIIDHRKHGGGIIKTWFKHVPIEQGAIDQLKLVSTLPFIHSHVAAMPDCHWGMGCTIGTVIATRGAVVPAAVGVDLGCGMRAVRTSLTSDDLPKNLKQLRLDIERAVPHGRNPKGRDKGAWGSPPNSVMTSWRKLEDGYNKIIEKYPHFARSNSLVHLGTLGGGNHFNEICVDLSKNVWVMLHSGSRGIGNAIGRTFITLAKKDMEKWHIDLPDKNLAYLPVDTQHFDDYWEALLWAQEFALINREIMMDRTLDVMRRSKEIPGFTMDRAIDCHHNFCARENHFGANVFVTRKGAVRAREGDKIIIPGSMGTKSYIVRGKGNPDSFFSCAHGAGRKMSRRAAKEKFSLDDHIRATEGVECLKNESVLDETPGAYKSIDSVMKSQEDLVEVVHELKQILCIKG